jgi:hypothetical protein
VQILLLLAAGTATLAAQHAGQTRCMHQYMRKLDQLLAVS